VITEAEPMKKDSLCAGRFQNPDRW